MESLNHNNITVIFLSLGIVLGAARVLGELAQRVHQPAVLGELLAGIVLGPTVLGGLAPEISAFLFPSHGPSAIALEAIATLAIVLFLMVAGLEVDLSTICKQGKVGCKVGISSLVVPFVFGFATAWLAPQVLGRQPTADPLIFTLVFAIAMSITALPVIAKTLMDMDLYRSDLGMAIISAAILNDLIGWILFAVVLGLINDSSGGGSTIILTIALTLAFVVGMLTIGRRLIHRALPFVQAYTRWPGGELSFALILALLGAAFTAWIGIHAIFGAFIVGAAIGDSSHLRERTRVTIDNFISSVFAPVFFASIGLKVNFLIQFDFLLVLAVLLITCLCKFSGAALGGRWGGMPPRESLAIGFGMVSVGAMGIIVGLIALEEGIIHQRLFVALVIMAMLTSMMSGPAIRIILRPAKKWRLQDALVSRLFLRELKAVSRREAIHEMTSAVCKTAGLNPEDVEAAVWAREEALGTGVGNGVALPRAQIEGLLSPLIVAGISYAGIDFDAPDGRLANVIFLILTPGNDPVAQDQIASQITRLFRGEHMIERALHTQKFTDFLALISATDQPG